jgi:hypothetical protein
MTTKYTKNFGLALPDFRQGPWHDLINNDLTTLDGLLHGAMSQANIDAWKNSTHYEVGAAVLDITDATTWMAVIAHTSSPTGTFAQERTSHPTYWTRLIAGFAPRGEWQQGVNYLPYDLAYDSARGIMALCTIAHMSTTTGSIVTDQAYWAFLLDMSDVGVMTATAVSYSNTQSGIPAAHVQGALDHVETQIKGLDTINIKQGNQIGPIPMADASHPIKSLQDQITTNATNITTLTNKTSFTTLSAPYFTATQNVSTQFGGSANIGYYMDANNAAIRPPGNGTIYFQSQGGAITYGTVGNGSASFHGALSAAGTITGGAVNTPNVTVTGGGIYMGGWGGNPNISVIFLNTYNNHYLYHDGTNVSFSGVGAVYAGNGRLWGNGDFAGLPNALTDGRLPYGGDHYTETADMNGFRDRVAHAVFTGAYYWYDYNYGTSGIQGFRVRYVQGYRGGWFTFPMA